MSDNSNIMALYATTVFKLAKQVTLPDSFAIITAHNPQGVIIDATTNTQYNLALEQHLTTFNEIKPLLPIIGCAPDMLHQEPSYIVPLTNSHAFIIAKQFKQNAYFWVENDNLSIVPVLLDGVTETAIGSFKARLV